MIFTCSRAGPSSGGPGRGGAAVAVESPRPVVGTARRAQDGGLPAARQRRQLLLQQLEVNRHRVQRVLHLVRHAGREAPQGHQLARVIEHGLDTTHVLQVARHQHHAEQLLIAVPDGVRHHQALLTGSGARLPRDGRACRRLRRDRHRNGPARLSLGQCSLDDVPVWVPLGQDVVDRPPKSVGGQHRAHRGVREEQLARRVQDGNLVLHVLDGRLEVGLLTGQLTPLRGQLGADGVEEAAQLAELVALREVQPEPQLAATEAGEAPADHVDRPQHQASERAGREDGQKQGSERSDERGLQQRPEVAADQERGKAHTNRAEVLAVECQPLADLEGLPFGGVDSEEPRERRQVEHVLHAARGRNRKALALGVGADNRLAARVADCGVENCPRFKGRGFENRAQPAVLAQRGVRVGLARHDRLRPVVDRVLQQFTARVAFFEALVNQLREIGVAQREDRKRHYQRDAANLLRLEAEVHALRGTVHSSGFRVQGEISRGHADSGKV